MEFKRRPAFARKATPSAPAVTRPPRRWRRLVWRTAIRLLLASVLAGVGVLLFVYFYPISNSFIDRRLQRQWRLATGLGLRYDRATFHLSRGSVEVMRPVLLDPDDGRPLIEADRLTVQAPLGRFLLGRAPHQIDAIVLDGPFALELVLRDGQWRPTAPWDRIWEILGRRRPSPTVPGATPAIGIGHLVVGPLDLGLVEEVADGRRQALLRLNGAALEANFDGALVPRQVLVRGRLNGRTQDESLRLTLHPDLADGRAAFTLLLNELESDRDLAWPSPVPWQARQLEIRGVLARLNPTEWSLAGKASVERIDLSAPSPLPPYPLSGASMDWSLNLDLVSRQVRLDSLSFQSDYCRLNAQGSLTARYPFPYAVRVDPIDLSGGGLELLAGQWRLLQGLRHDRQADFMLSGEAAGDFSRLLPRRLSGRVNLRGVHWSSPAWPTPLENLQLDARLTSDTLTVDRLQGIVGGIPVEFTGSARGDLLEGDVRRVDLDWSTLGSVEGLMNLIEQAPAPSVVLPRVTGNFTGQGSLHLLEPLQGRLPDLLERVQLDGRLLFQGGSISHPALPVPLEALNGELNLTLNRIACRNLTGESLGVKWTMDGQVGGLGGFWIEPRADLRIAAGGAIERLLPALAERFPALRPTLDPLTSPTGRLELNLALATDFRTAAGTNYSGTALLQDGVTSLSLPLFNGRIRLARAAVNFTTDTLRLSGLQGSLGAIAIQGDADLTPASGRTNLRLEGPVAEAKTHLPYLLRFFKVGGEATIRQEATFKLRPEAPAFAQWSELSPVLRPSPGRSADWWTSLSRLLEWNVDGQIQVRNLEWTFLSMPTPLRGINGALRYDQHRLWNTEPLTVEGGLGGRGLTSDFELVYPQPGRPVILRFDAQGEHFPLDAWATRWHSLPATAHAAGAVAFARDLQPDTSAPLSLLIEGRVRSKSVSFYRIDGRNFDGSFRLEDARGEPNRLSWNDVAAIIHDGRLRTRGRYFNSQMENEVLFDQVNLADLAQALAGREHVHGIFSGLLSGSIALRTGFGRFASAPTGSGQLQIVKSRFVSNAFLGSLGGLLKLPIFDDISFSNIHGPFQIAYPVYKTEGVILENPLMNLELTGDIGPDDQLDMHLRVQFLRVAGNVPLIGQVVGILNRLAGSLLRFRVQGTVENPRITPL